MPLSESLLQSFGKLQLPATQDTATNTLASLDPGRDQLLALFQAAINSELGAAWTAVVAGTKLQGKLLCNDLLPSKPTEQALQQRKSDFPLLCLHRDGRGVAEDFTLERDKLTQPWKLHWILGPVDMIEQRKILDVGQAIFKVCRLVARQRKHRAYQNGALQFFGDTSAFASLDVTGYEGPDQAGFAGGEGKTYYWAVEIDITTTELSDYVEGSEESSLEGADLRLHLGSDEGILPDAVLWSSDAEPGDEPNPQ